MTQRSRWGKAVAVSFAGLAIAGSLAGCQIFAGKSEYATYRQVRLADNDRDRVAAMADYAKNHPDGFWAEEINAKRTEDESRIWAENNATAEGLQFYLDVYPNGTYVEQARPRLAALQQVQGRKMTEAERAEAVEAQREAEREEARRTWATRAVGFWVGTLLGIDNWGSSIGEVARGNEDFNQAFGANPRPRCSKEECIKFYESAYAIPVPGSTRIDRTIKVLLRLRLEKGKLVRAEVLMPEKGFSRWYERENKTVVTDEDAAQRQEAINWALERIIPVIRQAVPGASNLDVVPEPIDPPKITAPNQPDEGADVVPGEEPEPEPEPEPQPAATPEEPKEPATGSQELDSLLDQAVGSEEGDDPLGNRQQPAQPTPAQPAAAEPEEMVLPIALQGFSLGNNLRLVLFAASEEDYGRAYDGIFIERVTEP